MTQCRKYLPERSDELPVPAEVLRSVRLHGEGMVAFNLWELLVPAYPDMMPEFSVETTIEERPPVSSDLVEKRRTNERLEVLNFGRATVIVNLKVKYVPRPSRGHTN